MLIDSVGGNRVSGSLLMELGRMLECGAGFVGRAFLGQLVCDQIAFTHFYVCNLCSPQWEPEAEEESRGFYLKCWVLSRPDKRCYTDQRHTINTWAQSVSLCDCKVVRAEESSCSVLIPIDRI